MCGSILKDEEPGEGCVHVAMQEGGAVEQHQPHLVPWLEAEDGDAGGRPPEGDALRPYGCHHVAVLQQHYAGLQETRCVLYHVQYAHTTGIINRIHIYILYIYIYIYIYIIS